ncbi:MAG: recombinase family protein [Devosia sp.]
MSEKKTFRCAIYNRKSSEEGLEQDFNSLEAQREACEAYIRSQAHEGWKLIPDRFDDGGFSGGNMDRPALGRLMNMIRDSRVDVIVIYKIDRLTRSLTDFARLAETFDKHGVSFVSVTQQFNTTTSMGRLMLNVLLSFAQFEREITGERIRDKIAASKKKGMWMGGPIPMGYDVKHRQLIINEAEAKAVRRIFELYLDEGNVPALLERLVRERIRTPTRILAKGTQTGCRWFTRGHVYKLLSNPLCIGRIARKDMSHSGQHQAIVDLKVWDAVQARLADNTQGERTRRRRAEKQMPLLVDRLFTESGNRMVPVHAAKNGRRYSYFVEQINERGPEATTTDWRAVTGQGDRALLDGKSLPASFNRDNWQSALRLPAAEIDSVVVEAVSAMLEDRKAVLDQLGGVSAHETADCLNNAVRLSEQLRDKPDEEAVRSLVARAVVSPREVRIPIEWTALRRLVGATGRANELGAPGDLTVPVTFRRRGKQLKLSINGSEVGVKPNVDKTLLTAAARAFDWFDRLATEEAASSAELAAEDGFDAAYVGQVLKLAFLSPIEMQQIVEGRHPIGVTADELTWSHEVPLQWASAVGLP